jgi:GNAT superfamily N-acetyltransferase
MIIRDITRDDYPAIGKMMKGFKAYLESLDPKLKLKRGIKIEKRMQRLDLLSHGGAGLIAEVQGRPVGYLLYFRSASFAAMERTLYMPDLYVDQRHRGAGVGAKLMAALTQKARAMKVTSIQWTVYDRNPKALGFYLNLGADVISDELIMTLKVRKTLQKPARRAKMKITRA